ncbi:hypothetical protein DENSPDRAFT_836209 [Dentipellis sp. KUC8613]|nr:hypothetical protein DENSPDRAFT_836209 [Dentipellis sp. KUC8613]
MSAAMMQGISRAHSDPEPTLTEQILACRPPFVHSLPIQILLTSVVLTLLTILSLHLLFTAQHHARLAPLNFGLQLAAVLMLMVSHLAELAEIVRGVLKMSKTWPYMLNYMAIQVPPGQLGGTSDVGVVEPWTKGALIAWCVMRAITTMLIQTTHIQFLTILYPSPLESRLIYSLLSPLAVISAITQFIPLSRPQASAITTSAPTPTTFKTLASNLPLPSLRLLPLPTLALVARQTINTTLSLLFTVLFLFWGIWLHPKQAWRAEGGTAAFGVGAVGLAALGTALGFVCVPGVSLDAASQVPGAPTDSRCVWLPGLVLAVILWQSYLGWWWWVRSGVGVDRDRTRKRRRLKKDQNERNERSSEGESPNTRARRRSGVDADAEGGGRNAPKNWWKPVYLPFSLSHRRQRRLSR